ncbi:GGDEF domain-containing protein [Cryptosporangium aurantiacum]|uniref:Diguanylate cyclase (GGDEF) domain-containing protein n=1 Tax=Cryptosporangium aurantiacum TaxID=134849 RepID=A0A1M7KFD5_9ACTN|nr:GGDEF domain-containing protein [Cryptosporangium aurantiacum]SHM63979.1 diguanylate cyclase (GGDEF) domain-containing protein [Cryptosporangium aurantiacum]
MRFRRSGRGRARSPAGAIGPAAPEPTAAEALLRRRRSTEITGIGVGAVGLVMVLISWAVRGYLPPELERAAPLSVASFGPLTLAVCAAGVLAVRFAGNTRRYQQVGVLQIGLSVGAVLAAGIVLPVTSRAAGACLVVLPILVAGIRFGRRGAVFTWMCGVTGYASVSGILAATAEHHTRVGPAAEASITGFVFAAVLGFFVAWTIGNQTAAVDRQVAALAAAQDALQYQATHDALTGLANRALLYSRDAALQGNGALLGIDLDGFKGVNDTYGHATGDAVLRTVASRLRTCVGTDDLVVRTGGDEFVIVLRGADRDAAEAAAHRVRTALTGPVPTDDGPLRIGVSVGVAVTSGPGPWDVDALAAQADARMYAEKAAHRR